MARFGRNLLGDLANPAFAGGLIPAGQQLASAPRRREEARRTQQLQKGLLGLEQMAASGQLTPEMYQEALGSYSNLITDDKSAQLVRETMRRVQSDVEDEDIKRKNQNAFTVASNAMTSRDPAVIRDAIIELQKVNTDQSRQLASQLVDRVNYLEGPRAQTEKLNLEAAQFQAERRKEEIRARNITGAWLKMSEEDRALFKQNLPASDMVTIEALEMSQAQNEKSLYEIEEWKSSKDAPLPVKSTRDLVESISDDSRLRDALLEQISQIENEVKDSEGNYQPGQKNRIANRLEAIYSRAFSIISSEQAADLADSRYNQKLVAQVEQDINSYRPRKDQIEARAQILRDKKDKEGKTFFEPKVEEFEAQAEEELFNEYRNRQINFLKRLVPDYTPPGERSEETAQQATQDTSEEETFTEAEEDLIQTQMDEYGKSRQEVIAALKSKGYLS